MLNILKILIQAVAAIWPLLKKHPKKSLAVGTAVTSAAMFYSGGVSGPFPAIHGGNSKNIESATDGQVLTYDGSDGKWNPEDSAGGGGGGLDITGTVADGDLLAYDATDTTYRPGTVFQNVKSMISGRRAAGVDTQTTGTGTTGTDELTLASATSYAAGHGLCVIGGGASNGMSAPANAFAIPRTVYRTSPLTSSGVAPMTWTANTTTDRLLLSFTSNVDQLVGLRSPNGQRVRVSNQGGALPTVGGVALTEGTDYYLAHAP